MPSWQYEFIYKLELIADRYLTQGCYLKKSRILTLKSKLPNYGSLTFLSKKSILLLDAVAMTT